ncbi:uncharacterized protein BDR25DRAFT_22188 [Lindgomyces ingoldianus]|uniref:Uncharacterized protein n=1 Tax=Lindgomyces ingoldianus TaxID=673940 RepID=A0ACB6QXP0_9PLEO|nr:uncharacterized protein BDR25DRAFT_22188 [Lindgomyces ingoldianus]KAF2471676.1 hypothetical protein BDR25DRAFT_22188 [Lindgomyces ingoldianus]
MAWRAFLGTNSSRRIGLVLGYGSPRLSITSNRSWKQSAVNATRSFHGGSGSDPGANQGISALVHSISANMSARVTHGPECFYHDDEDEDLEEEENPGKRRVRDLRDEIVLELDCDSLESTAIALKKRLQLHCDGQDSEPCQHLNALQTLLTKLAATKDPLPKYDSPSDYLDIFSKIALALNARSEFPIRLISVKEVEDLREIERIADTISRIALLNAAIGGLKGSISRDVIHHIYDNDGSLSTLARIVNGALLDAKDFIPRKQWFTAEEEDRILAVLKLILKEKGRRNWL